jgi:hypothetical protein
LRDIAQTTLAPFRAEIRRLSDRETLTHIEEVFAGTARSLLDFDERPSGYEDVGHSIDWNRRRVRRWSRSRYERIIHRVITRTPIRINGRSYRVERMRGWYEIIFRESRTGRRKAFNLDELVQHAKTKAPPRKRPGRPRKRS